MTNTPNEMSSAAGGSVTLEQLQYLLGHETETQTIDFKETQNLDDTKSVVELAKDVASMQIKGGYLVIGANSKGKPVAPGVPDADHQKFDEANLRPKLAKYLPLPFELRTAIHTIDDCTFALICVVPRPDGFCVFAADGTYDEDKKQRFVFRKGEVFARHGTTNERWTQSDVEQIRRQMTSRLKEEWWAEREEDQRRREMISQGASQVASRPLANFTWRLDAAIFDAATLELFRSNDDIPIRRFLNEAVADVCVLIRSGEFDDLGIVIGRVVSIAAQAITYQRPQWFAEALDSLASIYRAGFDEHGVQRTDGTSEDLWLIVLEHVLAIGALATRKHNWEAVRALATTPPGGDSQYYASWMRHALTMAARSHRLNDSKALITRAAERIAEIPSLRPDLAPTDSEAVISSLCQFDILAVLTIIAATHEKSGSDWYPNFARFYTVRSEPAVKQLLSDKTMRDTLFPLADAELAAALREVDRQSRYEGRRYAGWSGFDTDEVEAFLQENPAPPP